MYIRMKNGLHEVVDDSYPNTLQQLECDLDELEMSMELSEKLLKEANPFLTQDAIEIAKGIPEEIEQIKNKIVKMRNHEQMESLRSV